jgi:hypothetical protein
MRMREHRMMAEHWNENEKEWWQNENDRTGMVAEHENEKEWWQNGNGRTGMVAEHGMTDYSCSLNK